MANRFYPNGLTAVLNGTIDLDTDDIRAIGVNSTYTFAESDNDLADIIESERATGKMTSAISGLALSTVATDDIMYDTASTISLPAKASQTMVAIVYYLHNATEGNATLLFHKDRTSSVTADGGVDVTVNANGVCRFTNPA